ncbi:MAG: crotonase/enoyl-CoA hydratase family protein [Pseudomonadota bacterium]
MSDRVTLTVQDHVATLTLSRPDKMNALDAAMFEGIIAAVDSIRTDTSVRAVVLAGAGESFCSGLDVASFAADGTGALLERMQPAEGSDANFYQQPALGLYRLPVPVIAALQGVVFGGGLQIAMGADIRLAAPGTRLSIMEVKWGIVPDMGMTVTARNVVPADWLKRLALTGDIVTAEAAIDYGLITEVAEDPLAEAQRIAAAVVGRSPDAVTATKGLFNRALGVDAAVALRDEAETQLTVLGKENQMEAVAANFAKRAPNFQPRSG